MAAEYDHITIPAGSKVSISDHEGNWIASGALLEEYQISLKSDYGQLLDSGTNDAINAFGAAMKSLSGGWCGFSTSFKQAGFQVWRGTEPIQLQFNLEFNYTYNAYEEVVMPIRNLCRLPLPKEGSRGNLIPPGPSIIEAIRGPSESNVPPNGEAPAPVEIDVDASKKSADLYVNIEIGNMKFRGCIVTSAEPTFSKFVDDGDSPIYGRVAVVAITMHTATKDAIDRAMVRL